MSEQRTIPTFFINAFYHSKFRDNLFVIKAGGKIIEDDAALDNLIRNIRDLTMHGIKVLLVYGGGRAMDEAAEKRGVPVNKKDGRRITDEATLQIMKEVLGGDLAMRVNSAMARHDLEGYSFGAVPPTWIRARLRDKKPVDFGFVGHISDVNKRAINRLFKVTNFIACSCLCTTEDGQMCNINADTVATELAIGSEAHKLIFMSDVDGVKIDGKTAFLITSEEIPGLIEKGIAKDGMQVKLENCRRALEAGVKRIHLINGLQENALHKEIFESVGPGTMLLNESERKNYMNEIEAQKVIGAQK